MSRAYLREDGSSVSATLHCGVRRGVFAAVLLLSWMTTGCSGRAPLRAHIDEQVALPDRAAVLFLVDGLDPDRLRKLREEGGVPNIAGHFARGGLEVRHAITSLPSVTYACTSSLLTGLFPGHHGILGNAWFDRATLDGVSYSSPRKFLLVNEDLRAETLFDRLADDLTVAVQLHHDGGATHAVFHPISSGLDWLFGAFQRVDARTADSLPEVVGVANHARRWPKLVAFYFPGVDEAGHRYGSDSPEYDAAIRNVDTQIGRLCDWFESTALAGRITYVLASDHGHRPTSQATDLRRWLRSELGLRLHGPEVLGSEYVQRIDHLNGYDAVAVDGAYRHLLLHLRGNDGWAAAVPFAEIESLAARADASGNTLATLPGVGLVCLRAGDGRVRVLAGQDAGWIERRGTGADARYRYVPQRGDPINYLSDPALATFVHAGWHDGRAWLAATVDTEWPDLVPQIVSMFDHRRAGEIAIFAANDWSFRKGVPAGHGSAQARDMHAVLFLAGAGIPRGATLPHARLVDLVPTLLDLVRGSDATLDETPGSRPDALDGTSLLPAMRRLDAAASQPSSPM